MTRTLDVVVLSSLMSVSAAGMPHSAAAADPEVNISGNWTGECNRCAATGFTLVLSIDNGVATGTMKAEGTPTFGDSVKPILNGKLSGRKLSYSAKGDQGDLAEVELSANSDGSRLSGTGWYRGGSFGLWFRRASQ